MPKRKLYQIIVHIEITQDSCDEYLRSICDDVHRAVKKSRYFNAYEDRVNELIWEKQERTDGEGDPVFRHITHTDETTKKQVEVIKNDLTRFDRVYVDEDRANTRCLDILEEDGYDVKRYNAQSVDDTKRLWKITPGPTVDSPLES